ncbi:MAG: hypothetical protein Q4F72_02955, partial [Desulfovibrionaceae bacterium]|nr:hypothetical protein [Desulfovibrionaceae bacterium]
GHDTRLGQNADILFNGAPVSLFQPPVMTYGPYGEPVVPEQQTQFDKPYYMDWLKAFFNCVVDDAAGTDENFNPAQNTRLGELLTALKPIQD